MRKKATQATRVIVLAASKGGVGKTTLASVLAVEAAKAGANVALLDVDTQASLWQWYQLRDDKTNPVWIELGADHQAIGTAVHAGGWDWVFVDTPPNDMPRIETAIHHADLVLVPCRPSPPDVLAVGAVVDICREQGKAYVFLLNQVPAQGKAADEAEQTIVGLGSAVLKERVGLRAAYQNAFGGGLSGPEIDKDGKARAEIAAVWAKVKALTLAKKGQRHG